MKSPTWLSNWARTHTYTKHSLHKHFLKCDLQGSLKKTQYCCLEKSHGWRSLVGCSPWGHEESDVTEQLHFHFSLSCIGEGNGNPLQCSCLENPRDGGAWWAAVYGVAQSGHDWSDLVAAAAEKKMFYGETCLWSSQLKGIKQVFRTSQNLWYWINVHFEPLRKGYIMKHFVMCLPASLSRGECFRNAVLFLGPHHQYTTGFLWTHVGVLSSSFVLFPKVYSLKYVFLLNWHLFIAVFPIETYTLRQGRSGCSLFGKMQEPSGE